MDRYEIIWRCIQAHGYGNDYREVCDTNCKSDITVYCPKHGKFTIQAQRHYRGAKCQKCKIDIIKKKLSKGTETFVKQAKEIFGDTIIYDKVNYVNWNTKVTLECAICGHIFPITPLAHLHGEGCPECAKKRRAEKRRLGAEEFIKRSEKIHQLPGGEPAYIYNDIEYVNYDTPVRIYCKKCGKYFPQTPNNHLAGKGCPFCNKSKLENKTIIILEDIKVKYEFQKTFDWLVYNYPQSLDFYIKDINLAIECQGSQHYNLKDELYNKDMMTVKRDINKYNLCKNNNVNLLYVFNNDVNLDEIIKEEQLPIYDSSNVLHIKDLSDYIKNLKNNSLTE